MPGLELSLFGSFEVMWGGQPLSGLEAVKARALLAYLAVEASRPHRREALAALLWPERLDAAGRASLSQALYVLRRALELRPSGLAGGATPPLLAATSQTIQLSATEAYCDVTRFTALLDACTRCGHSRLADCPACMERLQEAVALYRGRFLEDLAVDDSAPFEEWTLITREHLHRRAMDALYDLAEALGARGEWEGALDYARRQVELDPWREEAQRQVMRLLARSGRRSEALVQYETCCRLLEDELGAAPAAETTALYEQIRSGALAVSPSSHLRGAASLRLPIPLAPDAHQARAMGPLFVAREQELAHLERWLAEALHGHGRVGFIVGEPGSGKTMLLREFARRSMEAHAELVVAGGSCNAYAGVGDPYLPFVEILRLLMGDVQAQRAAGAISEEHARRLQNIAPETLQVVLQQSPALIEALLPSPVLLERTRALPDGASWEARVRGALDHRMAAPSQAFLFDQATHLMQVLAQDHPLLLILDDLQWSDAASISLLFHLGRRLAGQRILILGAYRPEEVAAGRDGQPHPLQAALLELATLWGDNEVDLARAEGRAFVDALIDSEPNRLGAAFREALYRQTEGHALFSVELWRGLQERGDLVRDASSMEAGTDQAPWVEGATLDWGALPKRVEAVIAAHIARLSREDQELLAVASVEGEEFHAEVAARVLHRNEEEVLAALSGSLSREHRLLRAQSLHHVAQQRFSRYRFRHYLFQHYLYDGLDPVQRGQLHSQVAEALETLGAVNTSGPNWESTRELLMDLQERKPIAEGIVSSATMAWHWEQAGIAQKAAIYHFRACRKAEWSSASAYEEILAHVKRAHSLFATLPQGPLRLRAESLCYEVWAGTVGGAVGWADPEVGRLFRMGLERAEALGDPLLMAEMLSVLGFREQFNGDIDFALALQERAAPLAQGGPPAWVLSVQGGQALALLYHGDFSRSLSLYQPFVDSLLSTGLATADALLHLDHVTWVLWCLGFPDRAVQLVRAILESIDRQGESLHPEAKKMALSAAVCFMYSLRREVEGVEWGLQRLLSVVAEGRCGPSGESLVTLWQAWVRVQRGPLEQGIAELRSSLGHEFQYSPTEDPYLRSFLAEALARAGHVGEGLDILDNGLEQTERTGERWSEAELWRIKGELLLQRDADPEEVEEAYRRAVSVARGQEAKSWELRATMSLARLLRGQGRVGEAREMLAAIYGWFTEGFDTPDLMEAKALLEELAANASSWGSVTHP